MNDRLEGLDEIQGTTQQGDTGVSEEVLAKKRKNG